MCQFHTILLETLATGKILTHKALGVMNLGNHSKHFGVTCIQRVAEFDDSSPRQVDILMTAPTFWDFEVTIDALNVTGNFGIHNSPHYFSMGDWNGPAWYVSTLIYRR